MRSAVAATALLAILSSPTAQAAPLTPTGRWVVDFGETQCVASRNYGTKLKPLMLVLKQPPASEVMQLAVIRKGGDPSNYADQADGWIRVDSDVAVRSSMIKYTVKERGERVLSTNMPLAQFAAVRKGKLLSISAQQELNETFQLVQFEPLMKIMETCVADLARLWNKDGSGLKKPPVGTLQGLIRADDYPSVAVAQMKSGRVAFTVLINEQGRVADCTVVETSGVGALDGQSCAVVSKRARFKPAIGMDGKPAKSTFKQRITWRLED